MAEVLQERKPSYDVVRRIVRNLPAGLLMLAHGGNKAYSEGFDLVHRREALKPNAIWQVDHAQLDIKLVREDGSSAKPWLTIVIDDYSRAVAGYYLGFEPPSSLRTTLALRQGIWRKGDPHWEICGIPDILYTDIVTLLVLAAAVSIAALFLVTTRDLGGLSARHRASELYRSDEGVPERQ